MRYLLIVITCIISAIFISPKANATTWFPTELTCPLCSTKNTFQSIGSYGSYIYGWPSKYQLVYWPSTDPQVLYSCKHCTYTAFLFDFDSIPPNKKVELQTVLKSVSLQQQTNYFEIPMSERLEVAEKVYQVKGYSNEDWCNFYRVCGYHYEKENKPTQAKDSRVKAINYANKILADTNTIKRKYYTLILGSMNYFTSQYTLATEQLQQAIQLTFTNPKWSAKDNQSQNEYYNEIATDLLKKLAEEKQ
jgi:rubredoxin